MNTHIALITQVNKAAGSDAFYARSQALGLLAVRAFSDEQKSEKQERHRSQMTGLENIAETTGKVTDVLDFIKKQTAHQKVQQEHQKEGQGWKKKVGAKGELFGEILKNELESGLEPYIKNVCHDFIDTTTDEGRQQRQEVYLLLIRQFIRQLVVQYEYEMSLMEERIKA